MHLVHPILSIPDSKSASCVLEPVSSPPTSAGAGHVESAQIAIRIKKKQLSGERVLILVAYKMSSILVKSEWPSNRFADGKFTAHDS